ncbi:unnamed protein product [Sympodiomycopsis kandeliae]
MLLFTFPFLIIHHVVTYLYPLYASYKAIVANGEAGSSNKPYGQSGISKSFTGQEKTELAELEGWLMYWSVVGTIQIIEGWGEWAWSWLPFYSLFKMAFTLWLVLPQTKGSTYLYVNYLGPFLNSHEDDIDVALESARRKAGTLAGQWIASAWQQLRSAILGAALGESSSNNNVDTGNGNTVAPEHSGAGPTHAPPTMHDPMAGSASQIVGLVKRYGPMMAASAVAAMDRAANAAGGNPEEHRQGRSSASTTSIKRAPTGKSTAAARRRAQLEEELSEVSSRSRATSNSDADAISASSSEGETLPSHGRGPSKISGDLSGSYHIVDDQASDAENTSTLTRNADASAGRSGWSGWLRGSATSSLPNTSTSPS